MSDVIRPGGARERLAPLGQLLYDTEVSSIWDHDTATLSRPLRRLRYRYRDFAEVHLSSLGLAADRDPDFVDIPELFGRAAREGFGIEFMPPPWGTLQVTAVWRGLLLPSALKAEEFCAADGGLGLALLAHELGIAPLFLSGDLKAYFHWLRRIYREIRAGEPAMAAFAITEPGAGSDVEDTEGARSARLGCFYERVAGGFRITGRKVFISNGAVARWVTLFAAEKGKGVETWTCFLLDKSMAGFEVGRHERKMGQRAADASELILEEVFVPDDRVVGEVGAGWAISRNVLNFSRPVVGAMALGIARGAFEHAARFCNDTRLANRPLVDYQDVQLTLADMLMKLSAMRATVWQATRYRLPFQAAGAIAKAFCADTSWEVCRTAMTLLGDHGYVHSASVEKAVRDARLTQIYEGTNQINRLAIFESQTGAEFGSDCAGCASCTSGASGASGADCSPGPVDVGGLS
jgi:alkylation response protein AidB-like acyl-CoA dehydrogenase